MSKLYEYRKELRENKKSIYDLKCRVAVYCRVSTDSDDQLHSLQTQKRYYEDMSRQRRNWSLWHIFADEGITGVSLKKRDEFNKMIQLAAAGCYDLIICKDISRFGRNTVDTLNTVRTLFNHEVFVLFENDGLNTLEEESEIRLSLMAMLAQEESRKTSERVRFGHAQTIKHGDRALGKPPFGYSFGPVKGTYIINDEELPAVKAIFDCFQTGKYTLNGLEKHLYEVGYRSRTGKRISHTVIKHVLENEKYTGAVVGGKVKIADFKTKKQIFLPKEEWIVKKNPEVFPVVVDQSTFEKCQALLAGCCSKGDGRRGIPTKQNLYTSKLYCLNDQKPFYRKGHTTKKHPEGSYFWMCSGKSEKCGSPTLFESELNDCMKGCFLSILDAVPQIIDAFIEAENKKEQAEPKNNIEKLKAQKERLKESEQKYLNWNMSGKISDSAFLRYANEIQNKMTRIDEELAEIVQSEPKKETVSLDKRMMIDEIKKSQSDISCFIRTIVDCCFVEGKKEGDNVVICLYLRLKKLKRSTVVHKNPPVLCELYENEFLRGVGYANQPPKKILYQCYLIS